MALSEREIHVLNWIKDGKSNRQIAEILDLSEKTVEGYISSIQNKLGASNRVSAVVIGLKQGLIDLSLVAGVLTTKSIVLILHFVPA